MLQKKSLRILHVDRIRKVVIHLGIRKIGIRIQNDKIVSKMTLKNQNTLSTGTGK